MCVYITLNLLLLFHMLLLLLLLNFANLLCSHPRTDVHLS